MPPAPVMFCGTRLGLPGMCLPRWRATSRACRSYSPPTPTPISTLTVLPRRNRRPDRLAPESPSAAASSCRYARAVAIGSFRLPRHHAHHAPHPAPCRCRHALQTICLSVSMRSRILADIALRDLNVIVVLQIEPKLCRCAEPPWRAECAVSAVMPVCSLAIRSIRVRGKPQALAGARADILAEPGTPPAEPHRDAWA